MSSWEILISMSARAPTCKTIAARALFAGEKEQSQCRSINQPKFTRHQQTRIHHTEKKTYKKQTQKSLQKHQQSAGAPVLIPI